MAEITGLTLRDGTRVSLRPLVPSDREALAEAYRRLSPEARYQRFWTHTGAVIGEKMLDRILATDPAWHAAWAVLDPARDFPGIGAASWWRDAHAPEEAEVSVTVLEGERGRGVGTLLLAVMWLTALNVGVERLVAYALPDNTRAARWMRSCGGSGEWDGYKIIYRWELADPRQLPDAQRTAELATWLSQLAPLILK